MSRSASLLVNGLRELKYIVYGASFHILRDHAQPILNKRMGEAAPCWELRVNPLRNTLTQKIIKNGHRPIIDFPNGERKTVELYSFYPLGHILKSPLEEWEVDLDEFGRLLVTTKSLPDNW